MTLFVRNEQNKTIVDIEIFKEKDGDYEYIEISSSVMIREYTDELMTMVGNENDRVEQFIDDIEFLSELRGWLWEVYFNGQKSDVSKYNEVVSKVKEMLNDITERHNLLWVQD